MKDYQFSKKTSRDILYGLICAVFALCVWIGAGSDNEPTIAEIRHVGQVEGIDSELDAQICDLKDVDCDIEGMIRDIAREQNYKDEEKLVAIAKCESGLNPLAVGRAGERGLFQILPSAHPDITADQAFNPSWATRWTVEQLKAGRDSLWTCSRLITKK
jgi:hypothetical protein